MKRRKNNVYFSVRFMNAWTGKTIHKITKVEKFHPNFAVLWKKQIERCIKLSALSNDFA
jgi:hypothetical protein